MSARRSATAHSGENLIKKEDLIEKLKNFSKVFIVKPDMTYRIRAGNELGFNEDLGVMGYAFKKGGGIAWLRDEDRFRVVQMDIKEFFCHPCLAPKGKRIEEVI